MIIKKSSIRSSRRFSVNNDHFSLFFSPFFFVIRDGRTERRSEHPLTDPRKSEGEEQLCTRVKSFFFFLFFPSSYSSATPMRAEELTQALRSSTYHHDGPVASLCAFPFFFCHGTLITSFFSSFSIFPFLSSPFFCKSLTQCANKLLNGHEK